MEGGGSFIFYIISVPWPNIPAAIKVDDVFSKRHGGTTEEEERKRTRQWMVGAVVSFTYQYHQLSINMTGLF